MIADFNKLKTQVINGEAIHVLDHMLKLCESLPDLFNDVGILKDRYIKLENDFRRGILTYEELSVGRTQLTGSLLSLIDILKGKLNQHDLPVEAPPTSLTEGLVLDMQVESILGINNLKQMPWLALGTTAAQSVCRVLTPRGLGTGFLIGSGLMMTNWHVIPDKATAQECLIEFNYQLAAGGGYEITCRYRLNHEKFHSNERLDYAIVEALPNDQNPSLEQWGHLSLNPHADPVKGELVSIIQHPNGGLKQIVVSANWVLAARNQFLLYTTDTLPGSSGSPVFNDSWHVIAIHHAGGQLVKSADGQLQRYANEGVLMSHIQRDVEKTGLWPQ